MNRLSALALMASVVAACSKPASPPAQRAQPTSVTLRVQPATAAAPATSKTSGATSSGAEMVSAPASNEPIAAVIQREMSTAARDGKTVIVTVGAEWCEPCQRFHEAVEAGALDEAFPNARFVEFDLDRDLDRLKAAGYSSLMIPLFSIPGADGRDQGRRHMGAVKGAGAVDFIVTRLKALLAQ